MRFLLLLAIGILLIAINFWYFRTTKHVFFDDELDAIIGPFQIVSEKESERGQGMAMAHMLRARLSRIRQELESSAQSLEAVKHLSFTGGVRPDIPPASLITIPDKVFEPVAIDLSVAGVEVGGLLSRAHRLLVEDRILRIVVEFQEDRAIVVGNLDRFGNSPLYLIRAPETDAIITGIAYTFMQRQMLDSIPEVGALDVDEFESLITTLHNVADLNRKAALGRLTSTEYERPLRNLGTLVEKTPQWRTLIQIAAQVAENAQDKDREIYFYQLEKELIDENNKDYSKIVAKIDELREAIEPGGVATSTIESGDDSETISARLRKTGATYGILASIGVELVASTAKPRIAILGGLPSRGLLPESQQTIVGGGQGKTTQRTFEAGYIDSLVQAVQLVAPDTEFIFAPMTGTTNYYTDSELAIAWQNLNSTNPHVLLVTFGPLIGDPYEQLTRESVKRNIQVVFAKTPDEQLGSKKSAYESMDDVIVTTSVGLNGRPLRNIDQKDIESPKFWAPGEAIPTLPQGSLKIEPRSGNGYAAAIAAGIAGVAMEAAPEFSLRERIDILRSTARKVVEDGPHVINLGAALEKIGTPVEQSRGQTIRQEIIVNKPIPDNDPTGIVSTIHIEPAGVLRRIRVDVHINHTYIGDLQVVLSSPDGQPVILRDREGGSGDGIFTTYSSDSFQSLASLTGKQGSGDWSLKVSDHSRLDVGSLVKWTLIVEYVKQ